jgi:hypothetical protein
MIYKSTNLDVKRLKSLLTYDGSSGVFTWIENGKQAGCNAPTGYILIGIDGSLYLAHRLAWLYVKGSWPEMRIDHKDQNKANNRISNLRQATVAQNTANSGPRITSRSGFKGVCWDAKNSRWRATITVGGKQRSLGRHKRLEDAVAAYSTEAKAIYGEFAATSLGVTFYDLAPRDG